MGTAGFEPAVPTSARTERTRPAYAEQLYRGRQWMPTGAALSGMEKVSSGRLMPSMVYETEGHWFESSRARLKQLGRAEYCRFGGC